MEVSVGSPGAISCGVPWSVPCGVPCWVPLDFHLSSPGFVRLSVPEGLLRVPCRGT